MIHISPLVKERCPKASFGMMAVRGLQSGTNRLIMDKIVTNEIELIKSRYAGYDRKEVLTTEPLCHYAAYYKQHKKTYPVLGQLETVLLKGRSIPTVGIPVEAMYLAELKNLLLTAGHDMDSIQGTLTIDVAEEPLYYQGMSMKEQHLSINDLHLRDTGGVLSSVIGGPDHRTRITETTQNALYFTYGVEGVTNRQLNNHLNTIAIYLSQAIQGVEIGPVDVV